MSNVTLWARPAWTAERCVALCRRPLADWLAPIFRGRRGVT